MRRQNQIVVARMNLNVENGHSRQVILELPPALPAIEGNEQPVFGSREQKILIAEVLREGMDSAVVARQTV